MAVVQTSLNFLKRDELYNHEKPYQLGHAAPEGKHEPITVTSIRDLEQQFTFKGNGFTALGMDKKISYNNFSHPAGIRKYYEAVAEQLKRVLGADKVQVLQYVVSIN